MKHGNRSVAVRWGIIKVVQCECGYLQLFLSTPKAMHFYDNHRDLVTV